MITLIQEREIQQYLLSKNLNQNLFLEIKDHFIEQISTLMEEQKSSFDEAFQYTKLSWMQELDLVKADLFSFRRLQYLKKKSFRKDSGISCCMLPFSHSFFQNLYLPYQMYLCI